MCCKTIDEVSFAIMHKSACVEEPQIVYTSSLLRSTKKLHSITYDEANNVMKKSEIPILEFSGDNREKNTYELCYVEYGLLCIRKYRQHELVFLLNPLMGEVLELPRSTSELWKINWCKTSWYGMGFDCTTNTYKIVRVMEISHAEFDTEVHTLGTNSWRRIGSNPSCILSNCGVNAYGDMHWLRSNLKQRIEYETMIRSFDFKREEFKWIRYPNLKYFAHKSCIKVPLINLRGSLAIVNVLPYNEMEIWVMKDYDKKEYYWVREFRFSDVNINHFSSYRHGFTENFGAWGHRGLYVDTYPNKHHVIDLKKNQMDYIDKRICILQEDYTDGKRDVYSYTRSVIRLKNFGNPVANHSYNFLKTARNIYVSPR